jgi:hypothetical protein
MALGVGGGYNFAMSDEPKPEEIARRYIDLWQEQLEAMAKDPALADAMARAYQMTFQGVAMMVGAAGSALKPAEAASDEQEPQHHESRAKPPSGTAPAAAASDGAGFDPARLLRRVAEIEKRLARLEAAPADKGGGAAPRPRRARR